MERQKFTFLQKRYVVLSKKNTFNSPDIGDISTRSRDVSASSNVLESSMLEILMVAPPSPSLSVSVNMSDPDEVEAMELSLLLRLNEST